MVFGALVVYIIIMYDFSLKLKRESRKKAYCISVFIAMTLIMGLRSRYTAGVDTDLVYLPAFNDICKHGFKWTIDNHINKDVVFYVFTKIISLFTHNEQVYMMIISIIATGSFTLLVYRYSEKPIISFIVYMALGYYTMGFQMLRHIMAVSILLFSYPFLRDRRPIPFILVTLFAACFHSSALIFLIAYPFATLKLGWKQWALLIATVLAVYLVKDSISGLISKYLSDSERYGTYTESAVSLNLMGMLVLLCVFITSLAFADRETKALPEYHILSNMCVLSIAFMALVTVVGEFHRVSMFFGMFNTLLLPLAFKNVREKRMRAIVIIAMIVLIYYFLVYQLENTSVKYFWFYWQTPEWLVR